MTFIDAHGAEVPPGSSDAVTVRTEGFTLLRNGAFKIAATYHHPNPPPVSKRRCKTRGGKLPAANTRPASSDDDEAVAVRDAERIEPSRGPPVGHNVNRSGPLAGDLGRVRAAELGISRATWFRRVKAGLIPKPPAPPNEAERQRVVKARQLAWRQKQRAAAMAGNPFAQRNQAAVTLSVPTARPLESQKVPAVRLERVP